MNLRKHLMEICGVKQNRNKKKMNKKKNKMDLILNNPILELIMN